MTMTSAHVDLSVDQPVAPVPQAVIDGAATALLDGQTHYVETGGVAPLVARLQAMLETLGRGAPGKAGAPPDVLVTAGIQEARFLSIQIVGQQFGRLAVPAVADPGVRRAVSVRALPTTILPASVD